MDAPFSHQTSVQALAFSPDGQALVTGCGDGARLWSFQSCGPAPQKGNAGQAVAAWRPPDLFLVHPHAVWDVAVSPDGKTLATVSGGFDSDEVRLWDTKDVKLRCILAQRAKIGAMAISPDGKTLVTAPLNARAKLWEVASGKEVGKLPYPGIVHSVAYSPDGKTLAAGCDDRVVRFWDTTSGKEVGTPVKDRYRKAGLAFSPDGKLLFMKLDTAGMVYDRVKGKPVGGPLMNNGSWVFAGAFSQDGKTLVTGGGDGTARLWDVAALEPFEIDYANIMRNQPDATLVHTPQAPVCAVAFSPDGKLIATGCFDGTVKLWDAITRKPIGTPFRHQDRVEAVAFSADSKLVVTGSRDGTARVLAVPVPLRGSADRILLWSQVMTNLRLNENGQMEVLDGPTWQQRRQILEELGGPPVP
jgi:WD40 repeat protein